MLTIHTGLIPKPTAEVVIFEVLPFEKSSPSIIGKDLIEQCPSVTNACVTQAEECVADGAPQEYVGCLVEENFSSSLFPTIKILMPIMSRRGNDAEEDFYFTIPVLVDKCMAGRPLHRKHVMLVTTKFNGDSYETDIAKAQRLFKPLHAAAASFEIWLEQTKGC